MAATTAAIVGGVASAASSANSIMNSGGSSAPRWQRRQQRNLMTQSNTVTPTVAPFNADQLAAQQGVRDLQGRFDQDYAGAQATAGELAAGINGQDISQFYNPYENDVISAYLADLQNMRGAQDAAVSESATKAKAFGGDREAVYRASIQGDLDRTGATTLAGMRHAGYQSAADIALRNRGQRIAGNAQLGNLIGQRVGYNYADLGALDASGAQQYQHAQRTADIPLDALRFRSGINNPGTGYGTTPQQGDPAAGALSGFQDGYRTVADAIGAWESMRGLTGAWNDASTNFSNVAATLPRTINFPG